MPRRFLFVCALLFAQAVCFGGNWPQWRGPNMTGTADEKNLPVRWSATENITWKLALSLLPGATVTSLTSDTIPLIFRKA